jgi:hypothetical protein
MDEWIEAVCRELGLRGDAADGIDADVDVDVDVDVDIDVDAILEVAKHAAHGVLRPAAPVSTYLMGLAVARGADVADVAARISRLAQGWSTPAT